MVLLEAVQDGAINLSEELANVVGILRDDDKAIVVKDIALNGLVLARQVLPSLGLNNNMNEKENFSGLQLIFKGLMYCNRLPNLV